MTNFLKDSHTQLSYRVGIAWLIVIPLFLIIPQFWAMEPLTDILFRVYFPFVALVCHVATFRRIICPVCQRRLGYKLMKNVLLLRSNDFRICPVCGSAGKARVEEQIFFSGEEQV